MPCTTHTPIAIGHAFACKNCLASLGHWCVTTPMPGFPLRRYEFAAIPSTPTVSHVGSLSDIIARAPRSEGCAVELTDGRAATWHYGLDHRIGCKVWSLICDECRCDIFEDADGLCDCIA